MGFVIRPATSGDAVAACAVLRRAITECCIADHKNDLSLLQAWLGNKTPQMVATWFASATNYALVASDSDEVVGVGLLTRAGKVALCYLLPAVQGRGIGKALLAGLEMQARLWEIKATKLHSTATAQGFFLHQGYYTADRVRSPYGIDTVLLWKPLDPSITPEDIKRKRFCNCNPDA